MIKSIFLGILLSQSILLYAIDSSQFKFKQSIVLPKDHHNIVQLELPFSLLSETNKGFSDLVLVDDTQTIIPYQKSPDSKKRRSFNWSFSKSRYDKKNREAVFTFKSTDIVIEKLTFTLSKPIKKNQTLTIFGYGLNESSQKKLKQLLFKTGFDNKRLVIQLNSPAQYPFYTVKLSQENESKNVPFSISANYIPTLLSFKAQKDKQYTLYLSSRSPLPVTKIHTKILDNTSEVSIASLNTMEKNPNYISTNDIQSLWKTVRFWAFLSPFIILGLLIFLRKKKQRS